MERFVTKTYMIKPEHETVIKQVAVASGDASASAGLRRIIDEWTQLKALTSGYRPQPQPARSQGG